MIGVGALLASLDLEQVGEDRYRACSVQAGHQVVFGGQLLAQSLVAGARDQDGKAVKTLHTVFVGPASPSEPLDIVVDRMHAGRGFASSTVSISQGGRLATRSLVLLSALEPDFVRHSPRRDVTPPSSPPAGEWQSVVVGDVDIDDPGAVGPAELDVWTRMPDAPAEDPVVQQALLSFASDFFLIGTAMRPHPGVGQSQAHRSVATGVISHTVTFHEPFAASDWLLMSHTSPYAGHGRAYGRGDVFRTEGQLVASFVQDSMIRPKSGATG